MTTFYSPNRSSYRCIAQGNPKVPTSPLFWEAFLSFSHKMLGCQWNKVRAIILKLTVFEWWFLLKIPPHQSIFVSVKRNIINTLTVSCHYNVLLIKGNVRDKLMKIKNFGIGRFQKISILYHGRLLGFPKGRGGSRLWNSEGMGGIYDWKSEGMGEFHRWDFWSRKCRVSSLKMLLLWTFCSS